MGEVNLEQENCPLLSRKEIKKVIAEIMGKARYRVDIRGVGARPVIHMYYYDFLPEQELRRRLQERIPNLYIEDFARDYSERVQNETIRRLKGAPLPTRVWVYDNEGTPCQITLYDLIGAYLNDKEVKNGKIMDDEEEK